MKRRTFRYADITVKDERVISIRKVGLSSSERTLEMKTAAEWAEYYHENSEKLGVVMAQAMTQAREQALEEAAKECDVGGISVVAQLCAQRIRALKAKP